MMLAYSYAIKIASNEVNDSKNFEDYLQKVSKIIQYMVEVARTLYHYHKIPSYTSKIHNQN